MLFLFLAGMLGCVPRYYVPTPADGISIEQKYAVIRTDSLEIAVRPDIYPPSVGGNNGSYFSIWFQIRNIGDKQYQLPQNSFSVLSDGKQYDYIPLQYILADMSTNYLLSQPVSNDFTESPSVFPSELDKQSEQVLNLINSYLSFGSLVRGGRKEGYLYYDREILGDKQILIDVFGRQIEFIWGEGH